MSNGSIKLFTARNIDRLPWPNTASGKYAKKYLLPFVKNGPETYISNARTTMNILMIDDIILPITINDKEYRDNCYLCSLIAQYVDYAKHKLNTKNPFIYIWLKLLKAIMISGSADKTVHVNNWLLSTNLYPDISNSQLTSIIDFLTKKFPSHTIVFRSINEKQDPHLFEFFKENNGILLASRPVFMMDAKVANPKTSRMFKSDMKILKETDYTIIDNQHISQSAASRISSLYDQLNIEKYSPLNPRFSKEFIKLALKENLLQFKALEKEGKIDAVMGYFSRNGVITSPLFGYDLSLPQDYGLYRNISTLLTLEAIQNKFILNGSGGAGSYKKLRRARGAIEYHGIICHHLSARQKAPWKFLDFIMDKWGIPFIKKHEL